MMKHAITISFPKITKDGVRELLAKKFTEG
jgi:hypothetical protein